MNRRGFLTNLIGAAAAFAILPGATTYARTWVKTPTAEIWVPNPEWFTAEYEMQMLFMPARSLIVKSRPDILGKLPLRYRFNSKTKYLERVAPFIQQPT